MVQPTLTEVRKAKAPARAAVAGVAGDAHVAGVGIARVDGELAVKVNLLAPPPRDAALPSRVDGVRVIYEVTGRPSKRET